MKVLVVGNGGREHAMCRALASASPRIELFIAPGNPGTLNLGRNVDIAPTDVGSLVELCLVEQIDLVIPGPESALAAGIADALLPHGILCCGPQQAAARLEASKVFTRELAAELNLPSPLFALVHHETELEAALGKFPHPPVVKADGLASGKGVFLPDDFEGCRTIAQSLLRGELGDAGRVLVLEERLVGPEASLFYACSGTSAVALPHARDHKRLLNRDRGPNTGGMGAVSPNPQLSDAVELQVREQIVLPTLKLLESRGTPFCGFLFVGLMLTHAGPKLLEFNVRLGDPEAQAVLPRLASGEFLRLALATASNTLSGFNLKTESYATCAIVVASHGYPDAPRTGDVIHLGRDANADDHWFVHAGTRERHGKLVTSGGRVGALVARAPTPALARARAYEYVSQVDFDGMHYRTDVGV